MPQQAQLVTIAALATSFTAVCKLCAELDVAAGWSRSTFAGRLDLDIDHGTFLCRRGHHVRVERLEPCAAEGGATATAAA
jgi:hypothetical protein